MEQGSIVALIVGLIGGGGIFSILSQFISYKSTKKAEMLLRLERLHIVSNQYFSNCFVSVMHGYPLIRGEITYNQFNDLIINAGDKKLDVSPHYEVEVLVDIYFPQLKEVYQTTKARLGQVNEVLYAVKKNVKAECFEPDEQFVEFHKSIQLFNTAVDEFKAEVINLSKFLI